MTAIRLTPTERRVLNEQLWARDRGCVAPVIDPQAGPCTDKWGKEYPRDTRAIITWEHVQDGGTGSMGLKAENNLLHIVLACAGHHIRLAKGVTWCLTHKPEERLYLAQFALSNRA